MSENLKTYTPNTWCPRCGNFGILAVMRKVFDDLNKERMPLHNLVILSGIGCHGKIVDYINVNSFYSIHGRVLPAAMGIKLANPELTVIGFAGDGDAYAEGIAHTIFAAKRNVDITYIVHDNRVFGLTTGQFTPTSPLGYKGRSTPKGAPENPINPIELMLSAGATFVARVYPGRMEHMIKVVKEAIKHKGFSLVDVLQPCVVWYNTYKYYGSNVYFLEEEGHDPTDFEAALRKSRLWSYGFDGKVPIGVFYKVVRPTFEEMLLKGRKPKELPYVGSIKHVLQQHI